jgi:CBS domain-containing protein
MSLVRDAMVREVVAVASDTSLEAVARLFVLSDVSGAPVIDDSGHPLGVVSQRDLIDSERPRSGGEGRPVYYRVWNGEIRAMGIVTGPLARASGVAADVMSNPLLTIETGASIQEAARRMLSEHVHRLFVVEKGRLIGVVSALDCLRHLARLGGPLAVAARGGSRSR